MSRIAMAYCLFGRVLVSGFGACGLHGGRWRSVGFLNYLCPGFYHQARYLSNNVEVWSMESLWVLPGCCRDHSMFNASSCLEAASLSVSRNGPVGCFQARGRVYRSFTSFPCRPSYIQPTCTYISCRSSGLYITPCG
jgi:hypothetical protein